MTYGIPLTTKESNILLQLSECFSHHEEMGITEDELTTIEAKLRDGPGGDILTERLAEAAKACAKLGPHYSVKLDIIESGVRMAILDTSNAVFGTRCTLICPWTEVVMCRINPLLPLLDRALRDLGQ